MPTRNNRAYIDERLATIFAQTFGDWELVVADSFSADGTWEVLESTAARDPRVVLTQTEPDGIYPNWNRCLTRARGKFIYVAPADDTMEPTLLAQLVAAMENHPECGIAQCCLHGIDASGRVIPGWWKLVGASRFFGTDYLRPHLRRAPYDGVVHCAMHTLYHSITQILIHRRVFEKIGPFPEDFGPSGDFLWGMKAGLHCDVVHVPQFLATWRIHSDQASYNHQVNSEERGKMAAMVDRALATRSMASTAALLPAAPLRFPYRYDHYRWAYAQAPGVLSKLGVLARLLVSPTVAWRSLRLLAAGKRRSFDKISYTRSLLEQFGLEKNFVRLPGAMTSPPP